MTLIFTNWMECLSSHFHLVEVREPRNTTDSLVTDPSVSEGVASASLPHWWRHCESGSLRVVPCRISHNNLTNHGLIRWGDWPAASSDYSVIAAFGDRKAAKAPFSFTLLHIVGIPHASETLYVMLIWGTRPHLHIFDCLHCVCLTKHHFLWYILMALVCLWAIVISSLSAEWNLKHENAHL